MTPVTALEQGEWFIYHHGDMGHEVTVLRAPEVTADILGRSMLKVWCETGGREGYLIFGPSVEVDTL